MADDPTGVKATALSQAIDFVKAKPTVEVLLAVIVVGFYYGATYGVPYMLDRMDGTVAKIEASHQESQKEAVNAFRETVKELREDRKADRAEYKADRDEFRMWMKDRSERRAVGEHDGPPDGFIGLRRYEAVNGVKGGVE